MFDHIKKIKKSDTPVPTVQEFVHMMLNRAKFSRRKNWDWPGYVLLPYCIMKYTTHRFGSGTPDGEGAILLNRNYKPIGLFTDKWTDYDSPHFNYATISSELYAAAETSCGKLCTQLDARGMWMWKDASCPWDGTAYFNKYAQRMEACFGPDWVTFLDDKIHLLDEGVAYEWRYNKHSI